MVESKKDLAKRDVPSPNVADAFIMAFAPTDTAMDIWEALGKQLNTGNNRFTQNSRYSFFSTLFMHVLFTRF